MHHPKADLERSFFSKYKLRVRSKTAKTLFQSIVSKANEYWSAFRLHTKDKEKPLQTRCEVFFMLKMLTQKLCLDM